MKLEGSCHCQSVRFTVESKAPYPYAHCYCSICRKTQGGAGAPSIFMLLPILCKFKVWNMCISIKHVLSKRMARLKPVLAKGIFAASAVLLYGFLIRVGRIFYILLPQPSTPFADTAGTSAFNAQLCACLGICAARSWTSPFSRVPR